MRKQATAQRNGMDAAKRIVQREHTPIRQQATYRGNANGRRDHGMPSGTHASTQ